MTVSVRVKGILETQRMLKNKQLQIKDNLANSMVKVGFFMQGEVKSSIAGQRDEPTSVDTGRLLNSVDFQTTKTSATIYTDVPYAKNIEYNKNIKGGPRRHFNNSLDRNKKRVVQIIKDSIKV